MPKGSIVTYETALKTGKYVLIVHSTADEKLKAKEIIQRTSPESI